MTVAGVYLRVSSEDQAHKYSLGAQREACIARARELGATEIAEYADPGVSGEIVERPGLSGLRDAVMTGAVHMVVALDPDRLARNLGLQILVTEEIEKAGCRLVFVDFEWQNTAEGQLFYHMRGAVAQYEKAKIKHRTSYGRRQKAKQGQLPMRFKPYGYDFDVEADTLRINDRETRVVREIFRWFLEEGLGPNAIAARLQTMGVETPAGARQWYRTTVTRILRNRVYIGEFHVNRYDCTGMGLNKHLAAGSRIRPKLRSPDEWILVPVPPIIEPVQWHRTQQLLMAARRLWAGKPRSHYLLSGLVTCGECGSPMHGCMTYRRYYTCRSSDGRRRYGCGHWAPADSVEAGVWDAVWRAVHDPEAMVQAYVESEGCDGRKALAGELEMLEAALLKKEKGRKAFVLAMKAGAVEPEEAAGCLQAINEEISALEAQRTLVLRNLSACSAMNGYLPHLRLMAEELSGAMKLPDRKHLAREVVDRVVLYRSRIAIHSRISPTGGPPSPS